MHPLIRRLPAITALVIAAIIAVLAAGFLVRAIEARSMRDVVRVLRISGHDWARVAVDGLQVQISGTAPSESQRFQALTAAGTVVDSARVQDDISVVEARIEAPRFSIEILRNEDDISLFGLVPAAMDRQAFLDAVTALADGGEVVDLLESAAHPLPEGWNAAVSYGLAALKLLPRSKISITADLVRVNGISDDAAAQRRLATALAKLTPEGLRVAVEISAPRPAIAPFTLRFVLSAAGKARFDACSADTEPARDRILRAGVAAGITGKVSCVIGLGAPSPRWSDAAVLAIGAVKDLGGGAVTLSDVDISLVALEGTPQVRFDTVVGTLENQLPDAFSLTAVLPEKVETAGDDAGMGPPEFVATLAADGTLQLRGRVRDLRQQKVIDGFAKALFGAARVKNATRLDESVPDNWPVRVMAALESLKGMAEGGTTVKTDHVEVHGTTGDPEAQANVSRLLSSKLGEGADFDIAVVYDKKLDPVLGLPTAEECVDRINAAIAAKKILFDPGSADLDKGAGETLDKIAELMKNCDEYAIEIGGHTDSQGREEMNQALSQARAESVLNALLERRVLTSNLTARGYGETRPIADNGTEAGREENRRIEFRLVAPAAQGEGEAGAADAGADAEAGGEAGADAVAAGDGSDKAGAGDAGADDAAAAGGGSGD